MSVRFAVACDQCGWTGTYTSVGRAIHAHRRHSCDLQRARQARADRIVTRAAAVAATRVTQPCHHPRTQHEHGTHAAYVLDRCRCAPCTQAAREYEKNRVRQVAYGRANLVDAEPARTHIRQLQATGMGLKAIGRYSEISGGTLNKLLYGYPRPDGTRRPPAKRVRKDTLDRILAVRPRLAPGALIDATRSRRRLQALAAIGYPIQHIADRLENGERQVLDHIVNGQQTRTTVRTAERIAAIYTELENTPVVATEWHHKVTVSRIRNRANRNGWLAPAWWDADTIDNPDHDPRATTNEADVDDVAVQLTIDGQRPRTLTTVERHAALRGLHAKGQTDAVAARHLGVTPTTVLRDRHALGLAAVIDHGRRAAA